MEEKEGSGSLEPGVGNVPSSQQQAPAYHHNAHTNTAGGRGGLGLSSHKRKGGEEAVEGEPGGQRHARRDEHDESAEDDWEDDEMDTGEEEEERRVPFRFLDLPDSLHRVVMSFLENHEVYKAARLCKNLGPLYLPGIKRLKLEARKAAAEVERPGSKEESLIRLLGRLTRLEGVCVTGSRAVKMFVSSAAVAREGVAWMETLRDVEVTASPASAAAEKEDAAAQDDEGHHALLTLFGLLGQATWPRLQRLRVGGGTRLFTEGLEVLIHGLGSRGGQCERLRALELSHDVGRKKVNVELTDEDLLRRLLASPCCSALEALSFGSSVSLSNACLAQVIAYLRSPSGRQLEKLSCRWIPPTAEGVADPAMLINALADGCLPRLRKLELSCLLPPGPVGPEASSALERWAEGPLSQQLEVFKCRATSDMLAPFMESVRAGHGFPALKSLYFVMATPNADSINELCQLMEAGAMPCLESITLQGLDTGALARLMRALTRKATCCSATMKALSLLYCDADDEEGEAVGRALAAGACPGLKKLYLNNSSDIGDRTVLSIVDALRGGAGKQLEQLGLRRTSLGDEGCLALKGLMQERGASSLNFVEFPGCKVTGPNGCYGIMYAFDSWSSGDKPREVMDGEYVEQLKENTRAMIAALS